VWACLQLQGRRGLLLCGPAYSCREGRAAAVGACLQYQLLPGRTWLVFWGSLVWVIPGCTGARWGKVCVGPACSSREEGAAAARACLQYQLLPGAGEEVAVPYVGVPGVCRMPGAEGGVAGVE